MRLPTGSPARLTASATLKLPRWGLFTLCLLYILPGLFGRDPWKNEDAETFGAMWTMAQGGLADWLLPNVMGAPIVDSGPLMYWLGALSIRLFGTLVEPALAARLAIVLCFLLTAASLWYATYLLGRRPAAQPLALAFGGHPDSRDYGRVLADGALLVLLATFGILLRIHESSPDAAMLAMLSLALYAMARSLDQPWFGAAWLAVALAGLALTHSPFMTVLLLLFWIVLVMLHGDWQAARLPCIALTLPLTALLAALWPLAAAFLTPDGMAHLHAYASTWLRGYEGLSLAEMRKFFVNLSWYTWLAWPLALWALWSWRRQARQAHVILPGMVLLLLLAHALAIEDAQEWNQIALLPGLVILAAFGLPTLKRGAANAIDWFSLMIYSCAAGLIWLGWIAMVSGTPAKIAANIARQTPGFEVKLQTWPLSIALLLTAAWLLLVYWRITAHPKVLWRSVVLASGGLILSWALLATLWLPSINYSKTYRDVARSLATALPRKACVVGDNVSLAQRASFAYFAGVRFAPVPLRGKQSAKLDGTCTYLLQHFNTRYVQSAPAAPEGAQLIWSGRRSSDRRERFRLYRLETAPNVGFATDSATSFIVDSVADSAADSAVDSSASSAASTDGR